MNRSILNTDNYVAFIELSTGGTMAGCILGPTIKDVEDLVKKVYANTTWQQKPDTVCIYKVVRESNGYPHTGELVSKLSSTYYLDITK